MISRSDAELILSCALSTGGDFAEIFAENVNSGGIALLDSRVEGANRARSCGAGIRIFRETETVYAYTNDLTLEGMLETARTAAAALGKPSGKHPIRLYNASALNIHRIDRFAGDVEGKRKADVLHFADRTIRALSGEIAQVSAGITDEMQHVLIANTEGLYVTDTRTRCRLRITAVAASGSENQTGNVSPGAHAGYEFIEGLDIEALAKKAGRAALTMLHAQPCPAGQMPVVIENGFGGVIFHEACGHALEATSVGKGNSVFCGKLGQKIASDCVTAVDDGTIPNAWGSLNIDDEGQPTQRKVLIENGILKSYMVDWLGGRRMGLPSTGSGRRESYRYAPVSRMRNTFIAPGPDENEAIIRSMDSLVSP